MVKRGKKHIRKTPARQASQATQSEPNKIGASTPYDFEGKNLTPYGGLLPVATMLEKLGFQQLLESRMHSLQPQQNAQLRPRGHDGNIVEEAYRGRYARQRLLNFWPESSCGYHAIKRFPLCA